MNNINDIKCFIASPGDTKEERNACEQVFDDINTNNGMYQHYMLSSLRWEKDIYPSVGPYGQEVINSQIDGKYDLFVGIMKSRFGTPTPVAGSGTEEEFDNAYAKYKRGDLGNIFFYFGNPQISLNDVDPIQFQKVKDFKKKLEKQGVVYMEYVDIEDFKRQLKSNLLQYLNSHNPINSEQNISKKDEHNVIDAKTIFYDYRKSWEDVLHGEITKEKINRIDKLKQKCRFLKVIFPQEHFVNQNMTKGALSKEKAHLFALAVNDIGQVPSYYDNYHKEDSELNGNELWQKLKERESTLRGSFNTLPCLTEDWMIYEQIQRSLFHLDFTKAIQMNLSWNASKEWVQAKAMRMAVTPDYIEDARTLLDSSIESENSASEKLFMVILANFISGKWPQPYNTEKFWKYGLNGQGDLLKSMMATFTEKRDKPKRRGWIGSTWNFGSNHGDYIKSLRILQFIIDSGIYVSLPGTYMFDIASWYIVFGNLYEHFPYPCFFYSIQYNEKDVQIRIGQDFAYNPLLEGFNHDILLKSFSAVSNIDTPPCFINGILYVTGPMYVAVDEDIWFDSFKNSIFNKFLYQLHSIEELEALLLNVKYAIGSIKKKENILWVFRQLIAKFSVNESVVSSIIVNNLITEPLKGEILINDTILFSNMLSEDALDVFDTLNNDGLLSKSFINELCTLIKESPIENIPHNRVVLFQLVNLINSDAEALSKIKQCFLSMDIWHCGVLSSNEFGWTEPRYIRLNLLNDKIVWSDEEFRIIYSNLTKNVALYNKIHKSLHEDSFMKGIQVRYLSDMLKFIDGIKDKSRQKQLYSVKKDVERLFKDRTKYNDNIDLLMSDQSAEVDFACGNIYEGVTNKGIELYRNDLDFLIDRAILQKPIALTRNLRCIKFIVDKYAESLIKLGYASKLNKLLAVYQNSELWKLLDVRFAFNYFYSIAKSLKEFDEGTDSTEFWLNEKFVQKFIFNLNPNVE